MVDPKASHFWQAAIRSGLIDVGGLEACLDAVAPERRTPGKFDRRLARQAVESGRLTVWQAQQLLLGRWKGLSIGKYLLLGVLGRGGMGQVYLARDTRLDRHVAIKVLSSQRGSCPRKRARFEREARIAGQLQDEHLIRVYDEGEAFGLRFLVMEYIDGKSAADLIKGCGMLPPAVAAEVTRQVALALEYLDRKGLFHRDVTPSNILVDRGGTVKLTDFGLAVHLDEPDILTVDGSTLGTFDYLSPEQARAPHGVDIRADIYSLGCSCYHMIAGVVPYPGPGMAEKLLAHRGVEADPLVLVAPSCPAGLAVVVRRMMRKSPDERYARPSEVATALEPFASGPGPLRRIVAMGKGLQEGAASATDGAYAAEWFDSDSDADDVRSGDRAGRPASWHSQEFFPRIDDESVLPLPVGPPSDVNESGPKWWRAPWPVAATAVALALLASILAIALGFL